MACASPKPLSSIPERRSSKHMNSVASMLSTASQGPPRPQSASATLGTATNIPPKGASTSPLRRPDASNLRRAPSTTFVPSILPTNLLDAPQLTHSRVNLALRLYSPVFMGGATAEGEVHVAVDGGAFEPRRKPKQLLSLSRISVTLAGIERCKGRQEIFRALTSDLIDGDHPPPTAMAPDTGSQAVWDLAPSDSILPFRLDLPVAMGPPPYKSKKVGISYWLSALMEFTIAGKKHFVRQSREIVVLTVHDPEKALVNLPHPLSVSDELYLSKKFSTQVVKLTAGLHRQTWISGYPIFIDIHIENKSTKAVKKVEMQLEKTTLFHDYSAPSTSISAKQADVLRVPDQLHKEIVMSAQVSDGFQGVRPLSQDFRTCHIELPTGLVSIETGRFFGIRFFLNVQITCSWNKHLKVQLPISIVHPNSIDIPPNALAQVAASIEHKHRNILSTDGSGSPYRYRAGQAFKAARRRSYIQLRKNTIGSTEMDEVTRMLEGSPRKMANRLDASPHKGKKIARRQSAAALATDNHRHHRANSYQALIQQRPSTSMDNARSNTRSTKFSFGRSSFETVKAADRSLERHPSSASYGPHRSSLETKVIRGLRGSSDGWGPRLQRSTSGLGFDETDTETSAPRR